MSHDDFLKPRLTGKRFDGHTIPLEVLKDFSALEEMVVEVAKWEYKQAHPDSKRVQRNFSQGLELHLAHVEEGSAIPAIVLAFSGLFPADNAQYFEQARRDIVEAIHLAELGKPQKLPSQFLSYFDRVGRSLRQGEAVEFTQPDATKVVLTPEVRKRLIRSAQVEAWTEDAALRGLIYEMDQSKGKGSFHIELLDGTRLQAPLAEAYYDTVLEAFGRYRREKDRAFVLLQGVVKKDSHDRLKSVDSVEHLSALDQLDVSVRLHVLSALADGWLDGKGLAPAKDGLRWLAQAFDDKFDAGLALPYLYPTPEGGVQAEWSVGDWEVSLEIDLLQKTGEYQAVNVTTHEVADALLALGGDDGWQALNQRLSDIGGKQA